MTRPAKKSPEVVGEQLSELARLFQLRTVAAELVHRLTQAGQEAVLPLLLEVFEQEQECRRQRRVERLLRASKLPPGKTFSTFKEQRLPRPLAARLLVYVLLFSLILSLGATGVQMIGEFERRKDELRSTQERAAELVSGAMSNNLWLLNYSEVANSLDDMRASGPELNLNTTSVATLLSARGTIPILDLAIDRVASERADIGAIQNRLAFTVASANNAIENIQASESSIRDADIALEVSEFTRAQILTQAATAVLAQANALPQTALSLLQ